MVSLTTQILNAALRFGVKRDIRNPQKMVRHLRRVMNAPIVPSFLPSGIRLRKATVAGVSGHWLCPEAPEVTILYLHGGAFIGGRLKTYNNFCGRLAKALNAQVFLPDYRLAPEFPYPAATDDVFSVYESLCDDSRPLVVAGDSAGGNLTLVTLLKARDQQLPLPDCALAISPGADATGRFPSLQANSDSDVMLSKVMIDTAVSVYLNGADPAQPYISPCLGDYSGFPPLILTVSEEECLRDDAYSVAQKARDAGVNVTLISRSGMPHVWPVFTSLLPEARQDFPKILQKIKNHLARRQLDVYSGSVPINELSDSLDVLPEQLNGAEVMV